MVFRRAFGATALLCLVAGGAGAFERPSADAFMTLGAPTRQPFGHFDFCQKEPALCAPRAPDSDPGPVTLGAEEMDVVADVNLQTNSEIRPASDLELYGREERWGFPTAGRGDCEDYALEKKRRLEAAGFDPADLLLTVVRKADGTGHAVLTLRSTQGDFVLDNLDWRVLPWRETSYRFVKRQHPTQPALWHEIDERADPVVSATRR